MAKCSRCYTYVVCYGRPLHDALCLSVHLQLFIIKNKRQVQAEQDIRLFHKCSLSPSYVPGVEPGITGAVVMEFDLKVLTLLNHVQRRINQPQGKPQGK